MNGFCKTCKFWKPHEQFERDIDRIRQCTCPAFKSGFVLSFSDVPLNGAIIQENESHAGFFTGPEFGCINWGEIVNASG